MKPEELRGLARLDLAAHCAAHWPGFQLARHHAAIVGKLERVERKEIRRLVVCVPPRHGKSLLCSTFFPAWALSRDPTRSVVVASYGSELAEDFSRRTRNLLADGLNESLFPDCRLAGDSAAAHRFSTTKGGGLVAVGRGGALTGRGADLAIVDDPIKDAQEAGSEAVAKELASWFSSVLLTRLSPDGCVLVISTRWSDRDLVGLLETRPDWEVLVLPGLAEEDDPLGRAPGDALWPEKYDRAALLRIRDEIGSAAFQSLYQQQPRTATGEIFKRAWWRQFDSANPPEFRRTVLSCDTAFSVKQTADFSAITVWGETESGYFLRHAWRDRADYPTLKREVERLAAHWSPDVILIERAASGQSLMQSLAAETKLPIKEVPASLDKITRANAVVGLLESGRVFVPISAPWLDDFLDELSGFPSAKHDDWVDSTTQALTYLRGGDGPGPFLFSRGIGPDEMRGGYGGF